MVVDVQLFLRFECGTFFFKCGLIPWFTDIVVVVVAIIIIIIVIIIIITIIIIIIIIIIIEVNSWNELQVNLVESPQQNTSTLNPY